MSRFHLPASAALAILVGVSSMGTAFARDDRVDMAADIDRTAFEAAHAKLIKDLGPDGDRYSEISAADRQAVLDAMNRIGAKLEKATPEHPLTAEDQVQVFNDQELVNTIITHARADSRLFCERDQPTGSHRVHITCLTIAKWMEREQTGQRAAYEIEHNHNETFSGAE